MIDHTHHQPTFEIDWPASETPDRPRPRPRNPITRLVHWWWRRPVRPPVHRNLLTALRLVLGRVLLSTGVLLFGFVAYQLWGTSLQEARAQSGLAHEFAALIDASGSRALPTSTGSTAAPSGSAAGQGSTSATTGARPATATTATGPGASSAAPVGSANPPPVETADRATPAAGSGQTVQPGDPVARLVIDKIGLDKIVIDGVDVDDLRRGPGHFSDTVMPGERGNAAIAGHRTTFGAPFYRINELAPGDPIVVTTVAGGTFTYSVTDVFEVSPNRYDVVGPSQEPILTLVSCSPRLSAARRIIVRASLVASKSSPVSEPSGRGSASAVPAGRGSASAVPAGRGSASAGPTASEPTSRPGIAPSGSTVAGGTSVGTTPSSRPAQTPTTEAGGGAGGTASSDARRSGTDASAAGGDAGSEAAVGAGPNTAVSRAFRQGWFSDQMAWADAAIWGGLLSGVAMLAYGLSRRTRDLVGFLAGIVPFLVFLYFLYENLSRLLPPNL